MAKLLPLITTILFCLIAGIYANPARIVEGQDAPEGKYPYQVSLRNYGRHFCGGSIISKRWILTAAHCLQGAGNTSVSIVAGTNLLNGGDLQKYQSEYVVYHKNFSMRAINDDIGLIRVNQDIEFNDKVQPINLPQVNVKEHGTPLVLTGWGRVQLNGKVPNNLQEITFKVFNQEECKKIWLQPPYNLPVSERQICAFTKAGEGACHGDSGGPLVSSVAQVGIVSFGKPCAKGSPDVYTRVHSYLDWIEEQVSKFEN